MIAAGYGAADRWRTRTTFVLALSASAVGLGNLWRFSYLAGEHGGGAFVLTYVACLFLIAVPVLVAEIVIGHHGRAGPLLALRHACDRSLVSRTWVGAGVLACVTGLLILTLYVVVAGWALAYARYTYIGVFSAASAAEVAGQFERFVTDPLPQVYWQSLFLAVVVGAVVLGVRRGLGLLVWLAVPVLVALLGYLVRFGLDSGDTVRAGEFLFSTRPLDFSLRGALVALGHAFFTLGVGVGTGIVYGAYAPERIPIGRSVMAVAIFDTMIALLAGLAIFPVVFANNLEPSMGPGLLFVSVPYAFGNMVQGELFGALFFLFVVVAALGSAVAILEPLVASLMQLARLERLTATLIVGALVWTLGLLVIYSFTGGEGDHWYAKQNFFALFDRLAADILLPLVSLLTAIFVGWRLRPEILRRQLERESPALVWMWRFLLRWPVPVAIALLLLAALADGVFA